VEFESEIVLRVIMSIAHSDGEKGAGQYPCTMPVLTENVRVAKLDKARAYCATNPASF
jgi:hypothetical protein